MEERKKVVLNAQDCKDLLFEGGNAKYKVIEEDEWIQDYKYQFKDITFKDVTTDVKYVFQASRSGSPFTDWDYEWDWNDDYTCECHELPPEKHTLTFEFPTKEMKDWFVSYFSDGGGEFEACTAMEMNDMKGVMPEYKDDVISYM